MVGYYHGVAKSQSGQDERVLRAVEVNYVETAPDKAVRRSRKVQQGRSKPFARGRAQGLNAHAAVDASATHEAAPVDYNVVVYSMPRTYGLDHPFGATLRGQTLRAKMCNT